MHVARIRSGYTDKEGRGASTSPGYLRRTYRDGGKVRHETLANLSELPDQTVDAIEAALKGERPGARPAGGDDRRGRCRTGTSPPCTPWPSSSACPRCSARPAATGTWRWPWSSPGSWPRRSKLSTLTWWGDTTLGADLGVAAAATDDIYAAMDWLAARQDAIEAKLAAGTWPRRRTRPGWRCSTCPARGWRARTARWPPAAGPGTARRASCRSSTGCSPTRPGARSRSGCWRATPATPRRSPRSSDVVHGEFGLRKMVMVGDRG